MGLSHREYRKSLSKLRAQIKIIENNLRTKDYSFDYSKQPSCALFKYRNAFIKNDEYRYVDFMNKVSSNKVKMNTQNLYPYELVEKAFSFFRQSVDEFSETEEKVLNTTWNSLPDFTNDENTIVVVDNSGSMYRSRNPMPVSVALSLGLYFSERSKGAFKNHFIEFSEDSRLIEIKGETFIERLRYIIQFSKVENTNIEKVFRTILQVAIKNNVSQNELPQKIVIISDMEFDCCTNCAFLSNFENAKKMFEENGYKLPKVVFWNVESRNLQVPVKMNEQGVALVSGLTPRIFSMIAGEIINPMIFMNEILDSPRYQNITA